MLWEIPVKTAAIQVYSMILTAQSTGKKMHVFVDGCLGGFPKITGLQLDK
jgi:hypothetical protein